MSRKRIALYYPWVYLTSGAERTLVEIVRRSRHEVTIFTNEFRPESTFPELSGMDVRLLDRVPVERSVGAVGKAAVKILRQKVDLSSFDALLVMCEGLGDLMTLRHRDIPAFCLCLTPLRIAFDPVYRRQFFAQRSAWKRAVVGMGSAAFRTVDRLAWRRYRRVFPISREVEGRILAGRLAPPERMRVLNPGIDLSAFKPSPQADRTFFVPGRIMWTKNLELAIESFQLFRQEVEDKAGWRLVIAGIVDEKSQPYLDKLRTLAGDDAAIEFVIHPSDEEMLALYRECFATLFTAFNEDWGLVVIEAMASAKPVVAAKRGGPLEIVDDGQDGLLAQPEPRAFADAMLRLTREPELLERLRSQGPVGAARFGWEPFVEALDEAIESDLILAEAS